MKKEYGFEERVAVDAALKAFYLYSKILKFPVKKQNPDENLLAEYFLSGDEQRCTDYEKRVGRAVIKYCYDNPDIHNKKENARLMYSQMLEALRGAKIEADYNTGKLGYGICAESKRETLRRGNAVVQKAVFFEKVKKKLRDMPKMVLKTAVCQTVAKEMVASLASYGALGAAVAGAGVTILGVTVSTQLLLGVSVGIGMSLARDVVVQLTPKPIREKMKSTAGDAMTKAVNVIEKNARRFKSTTGWQKVSSFILQKIPQDDTDTEDETEDEREN